MCFSRCPFQIPFLGRPSVCCDLAAPGASSQVLRDNEHPVEGTRGGYAAGAAGGRCSAAAKRGPRGGTVRLGWLPRLPAPLGPQTDPCAAQQPWPGRAPRRAAPQCGPACSPQSRGAHTASAADPSRLHLHPREWRPAAHGAGRTLSPAAGSRPPLPTGQRAPQERIFLGSCVSAPGCSRRSFLTLCAYLC